MEKIADKLILVHYVAVGNHTRQRAVEELSEFMKMVPKDDSVLTYVLPTLDDTRVECINPKLVSEEDYGKIKDVLDRNQKLSDEYTAMIKQRNAEMNARAMTFLPVIEKISFRTRISAFGKKIRSTFVKR
jgi:hypothetical protein